MASKCQASSSKQPDTRVKKLKGEEEEDTWSSTLATLKTAPKEKPPATIDGQCPLSTAPGARVYEDYDCTLNQTNISANNNKFFIIQLLECNDSYSVWSRWGPAKKDFEKKFREKTKNSWATRENFIAQPGKYTLIEVEREVGLTSAGGGGCPQGEYSRSPGCHYGGMPTEHPDIQESQQDMMGFEGDLGACCNSLQWEGILNEKHGLLGGHGKWRQHLPIALLPQDQALLTEAGSPGAELLAGGWACPGPPAQCPALVVRMSLLCSYQVLADIELAQSLQTQKMKEEEEEEKENMVEWGWLEGKVVSGSHLI
ncbi:Poly [ADP-ribose] polymerase 3, partial [Lamprotornis superbus]